MAREMLSIIVYLNKVANMEKCKEMRQLEHRVKEPEEDDVEQDEDEDEVVV
jgi:hypothetical protein